MAYELKNHPLEDMDEYVQNLYIDILCSVAAYENENIEAAHRLVAHIMLSAGMKHPISEHIKNAMQITPERYEEFFRQCREHELQYIFMIDILLLFCTNGKPNRKQTEFLVDFASVFGWCNYNFKYLVDTVGNILFQDNTYFSPKLAVTNYSDFFVKLPDEKQKEYALISLKILYYSMCYVKQFVDGVLINRPCVSNDWVTYAQLDIHYESYHNPTTRCISNNGNNAPFGLSKRLLSNNGNYDSWGSWDKLILENVILKCGGNPPDCTLRADNINEIILRNCEVSSIHENKRHESSIQNIKLVNCVCDGSINFMSNDAFHCVPFSSRQNITAINCTFKKYRKYKITQFFISDSVNIYNCIFLDSCFGDGDMYNRFYRGYYINENYNFSIKDSTFNGCSFGDTDKNKENFQKFFKSAEKNNCQFIECKF